MRVLLIGALCLAGLIAALSPAVAGFSASKAWFTGLPAYQREAIQTQLTLTGNYRALVDGAFGNGTYGALTAYQAVEGVTDPSGVLSVAEQDALYAASLQVERELGMREIEDPAVPIRLVLPLAVLTEAEPNELGTTYASADGDLIVATFLLPDAPGVLAGLYATYTDPIPGRTVAYSSYTNDRFIVSGRREAVSFYVLFRRTATANIGFLVSYYDAYKVLGDMLSVYLASHATLVGEPEPEPLADIRIGRFTLPADAPDTIILAGDISAATPVDFYQALAARPGVRVLVLDSPGGDASGALEIARVVFEARLATFVPEAAICHGACAYVFLAGERRQALGELGVYESWSDRRSDANTQLELAAALQALQDFGTAQEVIALMLRTPPRDMHIFSPAELNNLGIDNGGAIYPPGFEPGPTNTQEQQAVPADAEDERPPADIAAQVAEESDPAGTFEALLLEASEDGSSGAEPFPGKVQWSRGVDEHGLPTLIARAYVPSRGLRLHLLIRKNSDPTLPATHLMEINFTVGADFIGGSVAQLPGILLKNSDLVQGTALFGATAKVVSNAFLFALSTAPLDAVANADLLATRRWLDLAVLYGTGKRAILTLEISPLFAAIFAEWSLAALSEPRPARGEQLGVNATLTDMIQDYDRLTETTEPMQPATVAP